MHSSHGVYYLRAFKGSEEAAMAMGINPVKCKLLAMMTSACVASTFGSIYAQHILYIDPFMVFSLAVSMKRDRPMSPATADGRARPCWK